VVDFGIARALATISPDEQSEIVWGSPQYFSPEQASGSAPSPASDVYSLGIMMFEMLTGQLPFSSKSPDELARLHRESPPPSPRALNPAIPFALEQIIYKALSKESSLRYATADQFGRALTSYVEQQQRIASVAHPAPPAYTSNAPTPRQMPASSASTPTLQAGYNAPVGPFPLPNDSVSPARHPTKPKPARLDWLTWLLAIIALIVVAGLVPFWLWVFYILNSSA
jgi:serine/threonine-protein kinase